MIPRTARSYFSPKAQALFFVSVCLLFSASSVFATNSGRVLIRESVSSGHRQELTNALRTITGWASLHFDHQGVLQIGAANPANGSASARELLARAVNGPQVVILEDASARMDVAFCRVVAARWLTETGSKLPAFVVLIDFADFGEIIGDHEARAAFNIGWGVLHELDHVVFDSKDSDEQALLGECETHINAMRREIGLPVRANYFYTESTLKTDPTFNNKLVRLAFEQFDSNRLRTRRYWIVWDSKIVGGLSNSNQTAAVRAAPPQRN